MSKWDKQHQEEQISVDILLVSYEGFSSKCTCATCFTFVCFFVRAPRVRKKTCWHASAWPKSIVFCVPFAHWLDQKKVRTFVCRDIRCLPPLPTHNNESYQSHPCCCQLFFALRGLFCLQFFDFNVPPFQDVMRIFRYCLRRVRGLRGPATNAVVKIRIK